MNGIIRVFKVNNGDFKSRVFIPVTCCTKGKSTNRIDQWKSQIDIILRAPYATHNLATVFEITAPVGK